MISEFIIVQTHDACKHGEITTRNGTKVPVWMAYRCLYCGEYFNQAEAEKHFGKTRCKHTKGLSHV